VWVGGISVFSSIDEKKNLTRKKIGKILQNDKSVKDCNIEDNGILVVVPGKKKPTPTATPPPETASNAAAEGGRGTRGGSICRKARGRGCTTGEHGERGVLLFLFWFVFPIKSNVSHICVPQEL